MTAILGITDGDDAGAALLVDGRLVAAVNEERLNRLKMSIGFPRRAVEEVLRLAGVEPQEVDHVAMAAYTETFRAESRRNDGWFHERSTSARIRNEISSLLARPLGSSQFARNVHHRLKRLGTAGRNAGVRRLLAELGVEAPISYHEHHRCHTLAAFAASGFTRALSISLDGGGDGRSSHVWLHDGSEEYLLNTLDSFDSIGNYYAYVTHQCGFRASIHEGKITGLAASGEPRYEEMFAGWIQHRNGQIQNVGKHYYYGALTALNRELPAEWEHRDLAASIQQHLEAVAVEYVRYWLRRSGQSKVCLSGGVFANVLLNQRIADLPECDGVFVFPAMGDCGLAAGAAFSAWRALAPDSQAVYSDTGITDVYLGPEYTEVEMREALEDSGLPYERCDNIEQEVAQLVHAGRVVARFSGRMEYGPRALGNRTILYQTTEREVNDWLNKRLDRTEFMPFAPACLAGHEEELFQWNPASAKAARYMTITLDCSEWMQEMCPAVVHIDGTARPQIVDREVNPSFHAILEHYHRLSGIPAVVNTSFNMHGEPIVCTPQDAIRSWQAGHLDHLAIGPYLLSDPGMEDPTSR